jgi:hypothetical protein
MSIVKKLITSYLPSRDVISATGVQGSVADPKTGLYIFPATSAHAQKLAAIY